MSLVELAVFVDVVDDAPQPATSTVTASASMAMTARRRVIRFSLG
jgi:hypothetical protein